MTLPHLYHKALDLCEMSKQIASYVSYNKDLLKLYKSESLRDIMAEALLSDAVLIPQQISRAENTSCLTVRLKSAHFISVIIRNMQSYCIGLEKHGVKEKEYLRLLRKETRSFQKAFKKWKRTLGRSRDEQRWRFHDYLG